MTISNVLLCGFGAFGAHHARAWRELGKTVLVAEPDTQARERAHALGMAKMDIAASPSDLLERADCVDIVSPPATHLELTITALGAGKPVLLEKPAVTSAAEAKCLMDMQAKSERPVQVNVLLRAHPMTVRALNLIESGAIGSLLLMDGRFCGWKRQHRSVGLLYNDGVHFLDLMRLFARAPIDRVSARALSLLGHDKPDDISIDLIHANGIQGRLALGLLVPGASEDSFVSGAQTDKVLRLVGDRGALTLDFNSNDLTLQSVSFDVSSSAVRVVPGRVEQENFGDATPQTLLQESIRAFLASVDGAPPLAPLREAALELARVMDGIQAAIRHPQHRDLLVQEASL
jgi:predicted dehydrogenase